MRLTFTPDTPALTASLDARQLAGMALPYGVAGNTSAGRVTVDAGALRVPTDLRRVKLFTEHGRTVPVGYTLTADDTPERLDMSFRVAATPAGDTALLEAAEGVRDALSVELDNVVIRSGHVTAADLVAVALTAVPAYADARLVTAADTNGEDMPAIAGQFSGTLDGDYTEAAADAPPADASVPVRASAPPVMTAARPSRPLTAITAAAGDAIMRNDPAALNAALVDIKWSDGPGAAGAPPQALASLWEGVGYTRRIVPNTTYSSDLSSMSVGGFRWNPKPGVDDYAGDKTAVPSFPARWVFESHPTKRLAGANDIDRAYEDLGVPGFWDAYWAAMAESYAMQSDEYVLAQMQAQGTAAPVEPGTAFAAIVDGLVTVAAYGGAPKVAIAANLVGGIADQPASDVPWLLTSMFGSLDDVVQIVGAGLADDTVMVWSQAAVTTKEAGSVPIRVQAVNIPNGGIDAALFGYINAFVTQPAAVITYTVAPVIP